MYVGPNKLAEARRYRATVEPLSGILSKVKKALYKITPKELDPHRMRRDLQKTKAQVAKLKAEAAGVQREAATQVADAQNQARIDVLKATVLPGTSPAPGANFSVPSPTQPFALTEQVPTSTAPGAPVESAAPAETDKTAFYVGLGLLGLGATYLFMRGRK